MRAPIFNKDADYVFETISVDREYPGEKA